MEAGKVLRGCHLFVGAISKIVKEMMVVGGVIWRLV